MMKFWNAIPRVAVIAIAVGVVGSASADTDKRGLDDDAAAMLAAKVTLADAIATAEKEAGGKAIDAGVDDQEGALFIAVNVVDGGKVQKVLVDLQTGKVVKIVSKEDDEEDDDGNDE